MSGCISILGFFTSAFSLMVVVGTILYLFKGTHMSSALWMILIFFSCTSAGGLYLTFSSIQKKRIKEKEKKEREILRIATRKGGRITPVEVAANSEYSLEDAKLSLDDMCKKGFAEIELTESGELVYLVRGIISDDQKLLIPKSTNNQST